LRLDTRLISCWLILLKVSEFRLCITRAAWSAGGVNRLRQAVKAHPVF